MSSDRLFGPSLSTPAMVAAVSDAAWLRALLRFEAGLLLGALPGEHERSAGYWQAEWPAVSETFRLAAGVVNRTREALRGLRVDPARMRANLSATDLAAESVDVGASHAIVDQALAIYLREELK